MYKIRSLKAAGVFMFIIYACGSMINRPASNIQAVRVTQIFPFIDPKGKVVGYDTGNVNIYYYKDQILYSDFYPWNIVTDTAEPVRGTKQNFFVFTKGNKYGLFFDEFKSEFDKKILVDSMLALQWYANFRLNNLSLQRISKEENKNLGILKLGYSAQGITDTSIKGLCLLSYNKKLTGIEFSLARELDTVPGMRLAEMKTITYGRYFKTHNVTMDTLVQINRLEKIPIVNEKEILNHFDRDKKYNRQD